VYSIIFLGFVSFCLALLLTPVARNLFRKWGFVDHPDADRKHHESPVPRIGGIPLVAAYMCSLGILSLTPLGAGHIIVRALPQALHFLPAVLLIFATGLLDDLVGLRPWQKFLGQIAAAVAAYFAGIHVMAFGGHQIAIWLSLPLTIVWLVLCSNAVNLIDGVDGLATGVGLFAAFTMLLAAFLQNNFPLAVATVPLVGCLLGFLRYNFNPATIFLGDSGSLFLGFLLGCFGIRWSQKSATILGMTAPLMALSIPLLDTGLAIVRRFLRGKPIFTGDRGHIHHRLLDRGMTPRKVALVFYGLCSLAAVFSLSVTAGQGFQGLVIILFCAAAWIGIQHLGYVELGVASRMFMDGAFRRMLSVQIHLQQYEDRLRAAASSEECWMAIADAANEFGFARVHLRVDGRLFVSGDNLSPSEAWQVLIPLNDRDSVTLFVLATETASNNSIGPFVSMLQRALSTSPAPAANLVTRAAGAD
jgi:UDP-GlcNAc:undecaprenyl-phosphate/decaprenyl-phosphate GlcNAc-1-phosphate transferase